jgi:imidazolonepropionase
MTPPMLIFRHARLVTMWGEQRLAGEEPLGLIGDGALIASGDRIAWLGSEAELPEAQRSLAMAPGAVEIDCDGKLLCPVLIDPHTHLLFAGDRSGEHAQRLAGATYLEIAAKGGGIRATVRAMRAASDEQLISGAQERLSRLVRGGVTTVEVKSGYGLSVGEEIRALELIKKSAVGMGCEVVPTLLGLHALPEGVSREAWLKTVLEELTPEVARLKLARGVDAFCESGAFTSDECAAALEKGAQLGLTPHLHADQLTAGGGAQLAARLNCASADHLERTDLAGAEALAKAGVVATLLPLAAFTLRDKPALGSLFLNAGGMVAIASNLNPGTQRMEGVSLLLMSACLLSGLTPAQALWAATRAAARALRLDDRGQLKAGLRADLVLFSATSADHLAWHAGVEHAELVVRGGEVVYDRGAVLPLRCST